MSKVEVYRFRSYDITKDDFITSTRMATAERIESIRAEIIPGSKRLIDAVLLLPEGWTKKHFDPDEKPYTEEDRRREEAILANRPSYPDD